MLIRFWLDDRGATAIEYCMIAGVVSLALLAGMQTIGTKLQLHYFQPVNKGLS